MRSSLGVEGGEVGQVLDETNGFAQPGGLLKYHMRRESNGGRNGYGVYDVLLRHGARFLWWI